MGLYIRFVGWTKREILHVYIFEYLNQMKARLFVFVCFKEGFLSTIDSYQ
jgi:hypothetical protein